MESNEISKSANQDSEIQIDNPAFPTSNLVMSVSSNFKPADPKIQSVSISENAESAISSLSLESKVPTEKLSCSSGCTSKEAGDSKKKSLSSTSTADSVEQCLKPQEKTASLGSGVRVKAVVQQCTSAKLAIQPASKAEHPETVEIQRGTIVYICFFKDASKADVEKMARLILSTRLSETDEGKLVSVVDLPGDVLIIPQATLGGTVKGKVMQYHKNIGKEEGLQRYKEFVSFFRETYEMNKKCASAGNVVRHGTYGIRQVFSCTTNGPYTHVLEI